MSSKKISIVVPCYREQDNIDAIHKSLTTALAKLGYVYELVFVDDGSPDKTNERIKNIVKTDKHVRLIGFSRNFGKEIATTAGIHAADGDAIIMVDADGQHPVGLIPDFVKKWEKGSAVVIGVRKSNTGEGFVKKYGSKLFYNLFNRFSGTKLLAGSTDFRLIDKNVKQVFDKMPEHDRITRGLIDWLGFDRSYIHFNANERTAGEAAYSPKKLLMLAFNSFTSLSLAPLYFFGYVGVFITLTSLFGGLFIIIEQYLLSDPLSLNITGSASLGVLILFLVGIILTSQGLLSVYVSKILKGSQSRPLYVVDQSKSS